MRRTSVFELSVERSLMRGTCPDVARGRRQSARHELVYGEFLIGDRGGRRKHLAAYDLMHQASTVPHRDLYGAGIGWLDIHLLASAIVRRL